MTTHSSQELYFQHHEETHLCCKAERILRSPVTDKRLKYPAYYKHYCMPPVTQQADLLIEKGDGEWVRREH